LQPQLVADADAESLAQILREHHAPTGKHVVAYLFTQCAIERIGGSGGKSVEHHTGAADHGEPERALGDACHVRHCGDLSGETLW
jgi:hypothetical protein